MNNHNNLGHELLKLRVSASVLQVRKWFVSIISITLWLHWIPPMASQLGLVWVYPMGEEGMLTVLNMPTFISEKWKLRFKQMPHSQLCAGRQKYTAQFHQSRLIWTTRSFSHLVLLCSLNGWQWSRAVSAQLALWQGVGHSLLGQCGKRMMSCW